MKVRKVVKNRRKLRAKLLVTEKSLKVVKTTKASELDKLDHVGPGCSPSVEGTVLHYDSDEQS